MRSEALVDGHRWLRLVDPSWPNPLDTSHAAARGGRWMPPGGPGTLHLNEAVAVARANLRRFLAGTPVEPEDLDPEGGYALVEVTLPRGQRVLDAHTPAGLRAAGLPATYPVGADGQVVGHEVCQPIGRAAYDRSLDGVHCRSAATTAPAGRELAWFPRSRRARVVARHPFGAWYFDPR